MSVRVWAPNMIWQHHPDLAVERALEDVLNAWRDTPYESGQRLRGLGADCVGSVFGVIDDLDGRRRAALPGFPSDVAMHSRETAVKAIRVLLRRYTPNHEIRMDDDGSFRVRPGHIIVTGYRGGGPGHVAIVGARPNELWHSLRSSGFQQRGWGFFDEQVLYGIYQADDDHRWRWAA